MMIGGGRRGEMRSATCMTLTGKTSTQLAQKRTLRLGVCGQGRAASLCPPPRATSLLAYLGFRQHHTLIVTHNQLSRIPCLCQMTAEARASDPVGSVSCVASSSASGSGTPAPDGLPLSSSEAVDADANLAEAERAVQVQVQRSRTGCLTCRRRKVKCDERPPTCGKCQIKKREVSGGGLQCHCHFYPIWHRTSIPGRLLTLPPVHLASSRKRFDQS
jgi:hypothetical protein